MFSMMDRHDKSTPFQNELGFLIYDSHAQVSADIVEPRAMQVVNAWWARHGEAGLIFAE